MLRHIKPGMLVFSVLYILLGLLLLLAPQAVADVFCIALGLLVVLCGLQSLYGYFKKDSGSIRAAVSLLLSLPTIALGMWALLCTVQSAMTFEWLLPLLFGLMLLVDGVVRAQSSFALAKRKGQKWWVVLLLSIVSLLCGALLACSQLLNNRNVDLLLLSGIFLLAEGILNLCCTIYIAMEFHALDRLDAAKAEMETAAAPEPSPEAPSPARLNPLQKNLPKRDLPDVPAPGADHRTTGTRPRAHSGCRNLMLPCAEPALICKFKEQLPYMNNYDLIIVGAGPAGIFTALELLRKSSKTTGPRICLIEKGKPVEKRHCPKDKTGHCVNCKPTCAITTWLFRCPVRSRTASCLSPISLAA